MAKRESLGVITDPNKKICTLKMLDDSETRTSLVVGLEIQKGLSAPPLGNKMKMKAVVGAMQKDTITSYDDSETSGSEAIKKPPVSQPAIQKGLSAIASISADSWPRKKLLCKLEKTKTADKKKKKKTKRGAAAAASSSLSLNMNKVTFIPRKKPPLDAVRWDGTILDPSKKRLKPFNPGTILLAVKFRAGISWYGIDINAPLPNTYKAFSSPSFQLLDSGSSFGCVVLDSKVYVLGGIAADGRTSLSRAQVYDTLSGKGEWEQLPDMLVPRVSPTVVTACGLIVVMGTRAYTCAYDNNFLWAETFDPKSGAWTPFPIPPVTGDVERCAVVDNDDGKVLVQSSGAFEYFMLSLRSRSWLEEAFPVAVEDAPCCNGRHVVVDNTWFFFSDGVLYAYDLHKRPDEFEQITGFEKAYGFVLHPSRKADYLFHRGGSNFTLVWTHYGFNGVVFIRLIKFHLEWCCYEDDDHSDSSSYFRRAVVEERGRLAVEGNYLLDCFAI